MKMLALLICLIMSACTAPQAELPSPAPAALPEIPAHLERDAEGQPLLRVYIKEEGILSILPLEEYLAGVVAGEMRSDWPREALRAQAILARTFVLKFVTEKTSMYDGADISTDVAEAQAYDAAAVDGRIREAVASTAGLVLTTSGGELPYAWFHAHSGGSTALAREALGWKGAEPAWTKITDGLDAPDAPPEAAAWEAVFTEAEILAAFRACGADPRHANDLAVGTVGGSGRAVTLVADGEVVNAASVRLALGSTRMRSTLLTDLRSEDGSVYMAGRGYGHGVGMPQWGAYGMAESGKTAEEIVTYYFQDVTVEKLW